MAEVGKAWLDFRGRWATGRERLRMLAWAAACALLVGIAGVGEPLDDFMRIVRNAVAKHPASGDIVVVAIDDKSLQQLSHWPWRRTIHAKIAENLNGLGAKEIFFDIEFPSQSQPVEDAALERAFATLGSKITLPVSVASDPVTGARMNSLPIETLSKHVELANINVWSNFSGQVWTLPYAFEVAGRVYPSFAAKMARRQGSAGEEFYIDFSIDRSSITTISAVDVFEGSVASDLVRGKTVVVGATSRQLGDNYLAPGYGVIPGVFLQVLGAETLKLGTPIDLGWIGALLLALTLCWGALLAKRYRVSMAWLTFGLVGYLGIPLWLERQLLFVEIVPSLLLMLIVAGRLSWSHFQASYRMRGTTNAMSGLANLAALRQEETDHVRPMVAARVQNYAEVAATLTLDGERLMVEQIARRLTLGLADVKLYQGDEGIFVWFPGDGPLPELGGHLEALFELFRSPVRVHGRQLDLTITFGVDADTSRSLSNRLGSALVAADEALREGKAWKEYDPAKLKDAEWKLSLLSQLDDAIEAGDLWIAYQPKLDLASNNIIGAEALARWTHPEKGAISPADFVLAAEQSGRIERLTTYILDGAISSAAELCRLRPGFNIAVNVSARLINDLTLAETIWELLVRYRLPADCLTLEITETAALGGNASSFDTLHKLRAMGVHLSIDDYGTGLSTLNYLKRIPANEIKIDKSFIQGMEDNVSDKIMVHSTIQLAHSLGRRVVAEGVEQPRTLDLLASMNCDVVQGFLIGVPMSFEALASQLSAMELRLTGRG